MGARTGFQGYFSQVQFGEKFFNLSGGNRGQSAGEVILEIGRILDPH